MFLIQLLINEGFVYSPAPEQIKKAVKALLANGGKEDVQKLGLLDRNTFNYFREKNADDKAVAKVIAEADKRFAAASNRGFNEVAPEDLAPKETALTLLNYKSVLASYAAKANSYSEFIEMLPNELPYSPNNATLCYRGSEYGLLDWKVDNMVGQLGMGIYFTTHKDKSVSYGDLYLCEVATNFPLDPLGVLSRTELNRIFSKEYTDKYIFYGDQGPGEQSIRPLAENIGRELNEGIRMMLFNKLAQYKPIIAYRDGFEIVALYTHLIQSVINLKDFYAENASVENTQDSALTQQSSPVMNNDTNTVPTALAAGSANHTAPTSGIGSLRPNFLTGNILIGYEENITLANGEKHAGAYALVDLDDILASHNEETFSSTTGFPLNSSGHNVNDRNYQTDTNAQKQVMDYAQNLDAERIITTSVNVSGTPIISKDGIVVSGNNRTMSVKLAAKRFPERYELYKQVLIKRLSRGGFGIDHQQAIALCSGDRVVNKNAENLSGTFYDNQYISMKKPFLVRIDYDFAGYTTTEFAKYNQDTKKSENPVDRAIKLGSIFNENPNCREQVVHELSMYDTFSDFYANYQSQNRLKKIIIDCGIITEAQLSGFYDQGFTSAGKDLIESLAAGMILEKEPLQAANMEGVKNFRQIIITSLPVLLKNNSLKEFSLRAAINEAVVLQKKMHSAKLTVFDFVSQLSVFDARPTRDGLAMQQLLSEGKITFKKSMEAYNHSVEDTQGASLFGDKPTKEEIFSKHILSKLEPKVIALLAKMAGTTGAAAIVNASSSLFTSPVKEQAKVFIEPVNAPVVVSIPVIEYKYVMTSRPFDIGSYPRENFIRFEEATSDDQAFGVAVYSQPISSRELTHWSFAPLLDLVKYVPGKKFILKDSNFTFYVTILESSATSLLVNAIMPKEEFDETDLYGSAKWMEMVEEGKIVPVEDFPAFETSEPAAIAPQVTLEEEVKADPFAFLTEMGSSSWEMPLSHFLKVTPSPVMNRFHLREDGKYEERIAGHKRPNIYSPEYVHLQALFTALERGLPVKSSIMLTNPSITNDTFDTAFFEQYPSVVWDLKETFLNRGKTWITQRHFEQFKAGLKELGVQFTTRTIKGTAGSYIAQWEIDTKASISKEETLRVLLNNGDSKIRVIAESPLGGDYLIEEIQEIIEKVADAYKSLVQAARPMATHEPNARLSAGSVAASQVPTETSPISEIESHFIANIGYYKVSAGQRSCQALIQVSSEQEAEQILLDYIKAHLFQGRIARMEAVTFNKSTEHIAYMLRQISSIPTLGAQARELKRLGIVIPQAAPEKVFPDFEKFKKEEVLLTPVAVPTPVAATNVDPDLLLTVEEVLALPTNKSARKRNQVRQAFSELTEKFYLETAKNADKHTARDFSDRYDLQLNDWGNKSWVLLDAFKMDTGIAIGNTAVEVFELFKKNLLNPSIQNIHQWDKPLDVYAAYRGAAANEVSSLRDYMLDNTFTSFVRDAQKYLSEHHQIMGEALAFGMPVNAAYYQLYANLVELYGKKAETSFKPVKRNLLPARLIKDSAQYIKYTEDWEPIAISATDFERMLAQGKWRQTVNKEDYQEYDKVENSDVADAGAMTNDLKLGISDARIGSIRRLAGFASRSGELVQVTAYKNGSIGQPLIEVQFADLTSKTYKAEFLLEVSAQEKAEFLKALASAQAGVNRANGSDVAIAVRPQEEPDANEGASPNNNVAGSEVEATQQPQSNGGLAVICNGQFFKLNPNKILGTLKETTSRYKKPITVVTGSLSDALSKLQFKVPSNMKENVMVSVEKSQLPAETSIGLHNLAQAINKTKNAVVAQIVAQKRFGTGKDCGEVYCFEQALEDYNPTLSKDEIECYVWYKWSQGDALGGEWSKMFHYSYDNDTFERWLEVDIVCFDGTSYVYAPIFYSGNLYEKITQMEQNGASIIEHVGEGQFHKQLETLKSLTPKKLSVTDPNPNTRLKINPTSNFAKNYHIASLKDGVNFTQAQYGYVGNKYQRTGVHETTKSLFIAFKEYVNKLQPNEFRDGATSYEVVNYFLENASMSNKDKDKKVEANNQRIKQRSQKEGLRLFALFLIEELTAVQQAQIDFKWNQTYNGFKKIDYDKIPVAFEFAKFYGGDVTIRPEKREAVAFILNEGSGVIAYDVGVGKTFSAIFTIAQFMAAGYSKRPLIVVPNQVYRQFIAEIKGLLPTIKVNEYFNLGVDLTDKISDKGVAIEVDEYSITVVTKDALELIGFSERTERETLDQLFEILNQGKETDKETAALREKLRTLMGRGIAGSMYNVEDFGFDFLCCDEAHMLKKIFTAVKGTTYEEAKNGGEDISVKREKSPYKIQSGKPSAIGLKGFMLAQYIQRQNKGRNVLLLTATPFTNSPLEIYSTLALVGYNKLSKAGVNNLKEFFDTYVAVSNELVITAKMKPERKQVVMSFDNLVAMQQLIRRFVNYKTGEDVGVERPNKIVLPLINKNIDGVIVPLTEQERIETKLPMSAAQKRFMMDVEAYMNDKVDLGDLCRNEESLDFVEDEDAIRSEGVELDENSLSTDEKAGVKILRGLSLARNIALSPHLYSCSNLGAPTYKDYVEQSPKLQYVMECIRTMKAYCQSRQWPIPGVIIYMDRGTDFFNLLKDYLMYELGYAKHEVGIVISGIAPKQKESIKNRFLGVGYNEETGKNFDLTDDKRMKVLIGSSTIKEGMNLQKRSAFIFNCFLDWNPTDVKQLEGRIWRFGNIYKNVFIINPLMENSIDSFIFQKLQEKTSRINEIFADNSHENTLKLEEMNPAELKTALITDPFKIAESEIQMLSERMQDQIEAKKAMITAVDKFKVAYQYIIEGTEKMRVALIERQPNAEEHEKINSLDTKGLLKYQNKMLDENTLDYALSITDSLRSAMRLVAKAEESMLKANGLQVEQLNDYVGSIEAEIEKMMEDMKNATSEEAVRRMADEIIEQRKRENYNSKSVMERVGEFAKLLPMLEARMEYGKNDKKVVPQAVIRPTFTSVPPVDSTGVRLITEDAISFLEEQIAKQVSTKTLHIDNTGVYTLERQAVHRHIVKEFTSNKPCQTINPVAILTGGLPGSGKSTYLKKSPYKWLMDTSKMIHVDADEVRSRLPEYKGWNANATHDETKDVVNMILESIGVPCTHDLVYDGTMNKLKNYIPLIEKLRSFNYQIFVLFVKVPFEVSKERVLGRYQHSGRFVPISIIEEAYAAGDNALNQIKGMVDGYIVVDGVTHELLEKGGRAIPQSREYKETPALAASQEMEAGDIGRFQSKKRENETYSAPELKINTKLSSGEVKYAVILPELPGASENTVAADTLTFQEKGTFTPAYTSYSAYLLDLIGEKYTAKFPGKQFDRAGVESKYNEILAEKGETRAFAMLEEIYVSYLPTEAKSIAFETIRGMKKQIADLTAPSPKFGKGDMLAFQNPKKKRDKFNGTVMKVKVLGNIVYYDLHIPGEANEITHAIQEQYLSLIKSNGERSDVEILAQQSKDKAATQVGPTSEDEEANAKAKAAAQRIRIIKLKTRALAKAAA